MEQLGRWWKNLTTEIFVRFGLLAIWFKLWFLLRTREERLDFAREISKDNVLTEANLDQTWLEALKKLEEDAFQLETVLRFRQVPEAQILAFLKKFDQDNRRSLKDEIGRAYSYPKRLGETVRQELKRIGHPESEIEFIVRHGRRQAEIELAKPPKLMS